MLQKIFLALTLTTFSLIAMLIKENNHLTEKVSTMKILCITHADFETPGTISTWAHKNNHNFVLCKPYSGDNCLQLNDFNMLIIMGGPQSAGDFNHLSYLADEIQLIQHAINKNKIVIGFCLGAQLIGQALGAPAEKSPEKEIGVFPIFLTQNGLNNALLNDLSQELLAIHWHNDMPGLTPHATVLAYSAGCPRQIIQYGEKVYGFQCHLEITQQGIQELIAACPGDLQASIFTQAADDMLNQNYNAINDTMFMILDKISTL